MRNTMRKEIKKNPSRHHRGGRKRASRRRSRRDQGNASPDDPGGLYKVARDNRHAPKDFALGRNREVRFRRDAHEMVDQPPPTRSQCGPILPGELSLQAFCYGAADLPARRTSARATEWGHGAAASFVIV